MRVNKVVGIDIGNYRVKVSYVVKGQLKKFFYENIPDNAVKDGMIQYWDAMAQFLKDTLKEHGLRCKNVIFNVPMNSVYIRNVELPLMTIKQLELNLPFEFHDFISEDSHKYFYDYSVLEKDEKTLKLLAVACSKDLINKYRKLAKDAKLNPIGLVPGVIGLQRILQKHNQHFSVQADKDYAILDMGDSSFKIHFFKHGIYDVTRSLEPGANIFAETISEINGTDIHISHMAEEDNLNSIQSHPKLVQIYESRSVEIMRALNFYSYSNTGNTIDSLYYCGGASNIHKLIKILGETLNLPVKPMSDLIANMDDDIRESFRTCPQSFGITIDPEIVYEPFSQDKLEKIMAHIEDYDRIEWEKLEALEPKEEIVSDEDTSSGIQPSLPEQKEPAAPINEEPAVTKTYAEPLPTLGENESSETVMTASGSEDAYSSETLADGIEDTLSEVNAYGTADSLAYANAYDTTESASDAEDSYTSDTPVESEVSDIIPASQESYSSLSTSTQDESDSITEHIEDSSETEETFHLDDSDDTVHRIDGKDDDYQRDVDDTNKTIEELTAQIMNGHFDL